MKIRVHEHHNVLESSAPMDVYVFQVVVEYTDYSTMPGEHVIAYILSPGYTLEEALDTAIGYVSGKTYYKPRYANPYRVVRISRNGQVYDDSVHRGLFNDVQRSHLYDLTYGECDPVLSYPRLGMTRRYIDDCLVNMLKLP